MRKIIFVNRYFYPDISATSQMLTGIAFGLAETNNEIHIVTNRYSYDQPTREFPSYEIIKNIHVHRVWTSRFGRGNLIGRLFDYLSFYVFSFFKLLMLAKKNDVVVAKTDPPLISIVCWFVCILKRASLINWLQDIFPEVAKELGVKIPNVIYNFLIKVRNKTLFFAKMNVVIGQLMKNKVNQIGVAEDNITVIENWADPEVVYPVEHENNSLRKEWGLDGKFVVGYSGNLGRSHDFSGIIEAAELLKENRDIVFLFVGEGVQKQELKNTAKQKELNILFKAYQSTDKLAESISVPDIHIVTLKPELEGLIVPSKIYGILHSGRKCIFIGDENGEIAKYILNDNENGYIAIDGQGIKNIINNVVKNKIPPINTNKLNTKLDSIENWLEIFSSNL